VRTIDQQGPKKNWFLRFLILIGITGPVLALSLFTYYTARKDLTELVFAKRENIAQLASSVLQEKFDHISDLATSQAIRTGVREMVATGRWAEGIERISDIPRRFPFIERVFLTDVAGTEMAATPALPGEIGKNFADRDWYRGVSKKWEPYVSDAYTQTSAPQVHVIAIAVPIQDAAEKPVGILVMRVHLKSFLEKWIRSIQVGSTGFVYLVDSKGHLAAHPHFPDEESTADFSEVPVVRYALAGKNGLAISYNPIEKEERLAAYASVPQYGWAVIATQAKADAFAKRDETLRYILFGSLFACAFSAGLALFLIRSLEAQKRAEESFQVANSELDKLANLVKFSEDAIIGKNAEGLITSWNRGAELLYLYSSREAVGKHISLLIPPGHPHEIDDILSQLKQGKDVAHFETQRQRKDGQVIEVSLTVSPVKDEAGKVVGAVSVARDITDRKRIERLKNEFISTVSHELRTPLTSIRGSLGLLAGGAAGTMNEKASNILQIGINNCERLIRLINDILDIEKIESGRMEFNFSPVSLQSLLGQAVEGNRGFADSYQVSLELTPPIPDVKVYADRDKIAQVLSNLLSNAVKFSPPRSLVRLSARRQGSKARISVQDQGPGVPREFRARIFEKFAQADSSDTRKKGGTGLGLSISKAIIEKHGGSIGFESAEPRGSLFHFEIPLWEEPFANLSPAGDSLPKLLICEDDADIARLLCMMVAQLGYKSDIAYSAKQALKLLEENTYAGMTLDILLPDQDGAALIHQLRNQERTKDLPIIVVSVKAEMARKELQGSGIHVLDWINKPINPEHMRAAIQSLFGHSGSKPRILHVEDDADLLQLSALMMRQVAEMVPARSLREAQAKLSSERFDLVLLDLTLPDGDGGALLSALGSRGQPPVIIFSAKEAQADLRKRVAAALVKSRTTQEELLEIIRDALKHTERAAVERPPIPLSPPRGKFLVCEDDPEIASLLRAMLSAQGCDSDLASSTERALELLGQNEYTAMTLDILLPGEDGISFLKQLRQNPRLRDLPIIVVSIQADKAKQELQGTAMNVLDWLDKPVDPQHLCEVVERALKAKKGGKARILHLEDNPDIAELIRITLSKVGQVSSAPTLRDARALLDRESFDLAVLDLNLPDGQGTDLLPLLRNQSGEPIPVIIFSSQEIDENLKSMVSASLLKQRTSNRALLEAIQSVLKEPHGSQAS